MSLAEPRKRRKNPMHSINLSAQNHWTEDDSKFGQRMLEKFGWSKGTGLGKNKQGIAQPIRVQHKVTPTGLGYIANNADDWFKAGEEYSRLLSQLTEKFDQYQALTEANDNKSSPKSLEKNSLNSKSRVHYHKFTKGKDLTQYKKEELACILGKGTKDDDHNVDSLNMQEYFKIKQKSKKLLLDKQDITPSNEDHFDISKKKKKKSQTLTNATNENVDNVDQVASECNSIDDKVTEEQEELVLTHKYQNLVDLLIENSSAGKKYCTHSPSSLFEKRMKEFADSVKNQYSTTVCSELKPANEEQKLNSIILNPDDKNFIRNFEAQKSKALESIVKRQEMSKYVNEKSMFIAKHGDVIFFGSNLNDIKGYGDW